MSRAKFFMAAAIAALFCASTPASAQSVPNLSFRPSDRGFVQRMCALGQQYPGRVAVCKLNSRPAIFINSNFSGNTAQRDQFKSALLSALGSSTVHAYNDGGHLHVGTGKGGATQLRAAYQGRNIDLYDSLNLCDYSLPSYERSCVMFKLPSTALTKFDTYVNAIETDFEGTLGETVYEGQPAPPPYFSGNSSNAHNCTTWFSYFMRLKADRSVQSRHSPYMFTSKNAEANASSMRGVLVFNMQNAPAHGSDLASSFFQRLTWE